MEPFDYWGPQTDCGLASIRGYQLGCFPAPVGRALPLWSITAKPAALSRASAGHARVQVSKPSLKSGISVRRSLLLPIKSYRARKGRAASSMQNA